MATDFKYASQSDLNRYCGEIVANADSKRQIYDWASGISNFDSGTSVDIFYTHNTGFIDSLFWDGAKILKTTFRGGSSTTQGILNGAMTDTTTEFYLDGGHSIESKDIIKIDSEYIYVTDSTGNTITTTLANRGLFDTSSVAHANDSSVYMIVDEDGDIGGGTSGGQDALGFVYDDELDLCLLIGKVDPSDYVIESGFDNETYYDQMLVDASMELNNLLDARYPTPLLAISQIDINTDSVNQVKEYDAIVIKMTCYLTASNALRATGEIERADYYYDLVTNSERTGMADRLNTGEFKLSFEVDAKDSQGKVNKIVSSGSMDIVETAGEYVGQKYDLLRITCTTTGAYGVAYVKVEYMANDKIFGAESGPQIVTGGLQSLSGLGGLLVRFQGASMTEADLWEIEVSSADRKITNAQTGAIDLTRRGYSY